MQIQINSDSTIERNAGLDQHVQSVIGSAVARFQDSITRVEVHLSDKNSQKSADGDNRCMIEARVTGYQPIAVSDHNATLHQAIAGAADKLKRAIDSALGRLQDGKRHAGEKMVAELDADEVTE
jgi:ribosome-associated translation inhibitor RaiA